MSLVRKLLKIIVLVLFIFALVFPVYWMFLSSIRPFNLLISRNDTLYPTKTTMGNYINVFTVQSGGTIFPTYLKNGVIVAITTMAFVTIVSIGGGYALARTKFRGSLFFQRAILFVYIIPSILLAIPLYQFAIWLGLINTLWSLVLAHSTLGIPFGVWLLRGYFAKLPRDLEDSAAIDGASFPITLVRIVLPMALPALVAVAIFAFIQSWNEYLYAYIFIDNTLLKTIQPGLGAYIQLTTGGTQWGPLMAASTLVTLPVYLFFIFLQRYLIGGLTAGAVKH